jgi:hypothetical protein
MFGYKVIETSLVAKMNSGNTERIASVKEIADKVRKSPIGVVKSPIKPRKSPIGVVKSPIKPEETPIARINRR